VIGDVLADPAEHRDLGAAVDVDVLDGALRLGQYLVRASLVSYRWLWASKRW
jgi:hypothetical protein